MSADSFFATTSELIDVNRQSVTSLSSDTSPVYNITIGYDINAALTAADVKMPYVADDSDPQNTNGSLVNDLALQDIQLQSFLTTLKTNWASRSLSGSGNLVLQQSIGVPSSNDSNFWVSVCWSNTLGLFAAVAYDGTNKVMTSSNGINWVARTSSNENINWNSICWADTLGLFIAVGGNGANAIMTSSDGITWTERINFYYNDNWSSVCWSTTLGLILAVGSSEITTSSNGIDWTHTDISNVSFTSVCWADTIGLFVAVAVDTSGEISTNIVMTSSNGINWVARTASSDVNNWYSICWSNTLNLLVAVCYDGTNRVMTSSNGIDWVARTSSNENVLWFAVSWANELGLFVACGIGSLMTSPDGINWTNKTASNNNEFYSICWVPELSLIVAVAGGGTNSVMKIQGMSESSNTLGTQVRDHLAILFDKSNLNQILGISTAPAVVYDSNGRPVGDAAANPVTGISTTAYLDQTKINALLNNVNHNFSLKLMSMVQLKQVLDGVADSGRKRGVDDEGKPKYAFTTGDSINSVVIVHDADAEGLSNPIINQDKWIFTIQQL